MPRSFSAARRTAGLALLALESMLAVLVLCCPHVTPFYREYYITRQRQCWMPQPLVNSTAQALRRARISLATLSKPEACYLLMQGWNQKAAWGIWSSEAGAELDIPVPPGGNAVMLTLRAVSASNIEKATVFVNGTFLQREFLVPGQLEKLTLPVTAGSLRDLQIEFDRIDPSSRQGIGVSSITWGHA